LYQERQTCLLSSTRPCSCSSLCARSSLSLRSFC
jgi:hypothetical protein